MSERTSRDTTLLGRFRDGLAHRISNLALNHIATDWYRTMISGAVRLGLESAAEGGPREPEWEYGVEYEVNAERSVYTAAHSEEMARKWVAESPTDTGLRRRRKAGPWEEVPE